MAAATHPKLFVGEMPNVGRAHAVLQPAARARRRAPTARERCTFTVPVVRPIARAMSSRADSSTKTQMEDHALLQQKGTRGRRSGDPSPRGPGDRAPATGRGSRARRGPRPRARPRAGSGRGASPRTYAAALGVVLHEVRGDAQEPGVGPGLAAEAIPPAPGPEEALLRHRAREMGSWRHPRERNGETLRWGASPHEGFERALVQHLPEGESEGGRGAEGGRAHAREVYRRRRAAGV